MTPVSLDAVAGELQLLDATSTAYLHRSTGETVIVQEEDARLAEESDEHALPDWQREMLVTVREALASDEWLALPDSWEIDDYRIMERFCLSVAPDDGGEALERAIRGSGAFRRFRDAVARLGLEDRWYAHRDDAYRDVAARWLEDHGIPFEPRGGPPAAGASAQPA